MKKILVLMILSLVGFTALFGCESPFDDVKGMTCEIEYILCVDRNIDIKLCDNVKERCKQYEEEFAIADEKCERLERAAKELEIKAEALEKELNVNDENYNKKFFEIIKLIREAADLRKMEREASDIAYAVLINFLGEDNLMLLQSTEFTTELENALTNMGE